MQNLLTQLMNENGVPYNSVDAVNTYKALCQTSPRSVEWQLAVLDTDGNFLLDLSKYFKSANISFSDEMMAHKAAYVLANAADSNGVAMFDVYGAGLHSDKVQVDKNIFRLRIGFKDPATGNAYLLPAHYGRIMNVDANYSPSGEQTIQIDCADSLKHPIKQTINTGAYQNTDTNLVATQILKRWGKFTDDQIDLAALPDGRTMYPFVQFTDFKLADAMKTMYDPVLFSVRADEAGRIITRPRIGSPVFGAGLKGYPDQTTAPTPSLVAYTIPRAFGISSARSQAQDYDGIYNQMMVQGQLTDSVQSLGPLRQLYQDGDIENDPNQIDKGGKKTPRYPFSQNGGSGGGVIVAKNVIVRLDYYTNAANKRVVYLSNLVFRGLWDPGTAYSEGDAVEYDAGDGLTVYVCREAAKGSSQSPLSTTRWEVTEIMRPFPPVTNAVRSTKRPGPQPGTFITTSVADNSTDLPWVSGCNLYNEDPHLVGYARIEAQTPSYVTLRLEGRQYTAGGALDGGYRHRGGFAYEVSLLGQPILARSRTITAYSDYNNSLVIGEALTELFGDRRTFQAEHEPLAMSVPVEVFKDGVSLGKVAADQTDLTGEPNFGVDFERGRIVLQDLLYQPFVADDASSHIYSTGGTAQTTTETFVTRELLVKVPQTVLQTRREGDLIYTFSGLTLGQGYDIRLTFADPTSTKEGQRVFSVYAQSEKVIEGLDIWRTAGGTKKAWQETLSGIAPGFDGKIEILVTQHAPGAAGTFGALLPECSANGDGTGAAKGVSIISAIEVMLSGDEIGAASPAVNCGGAAISPAVPVITANYGFSPAQEDAQAQQLQFNNPLIASQGACQDMADWQCDFSQWKKNPMPVTTNTIPHLQPGDILAFYHPRIKKNAWVYVATINRKLTAPNADGKGGGDVDEYGNYLIYLEN